VPSGRIAIASPSSTSVLTGSASTAAMISGTASTSFSARV
jgi:hypothetical protein